MTDADRLRQAAREMNDPLADEVSRHTSALLWAVADNHSDDFCTCMFQAVGTPPDRACAAAVALADSILGDSE